MTNPLTVLLYNIVMATWKICAYSVFQPTNRDTEFFLQTLCKIIYFLFSKMQSLRWSIRGANWTVMFCRKSIYGKLFPVSFDERNDCDNWEIVSKGSWCETLMSKLKGQIGNRNWRYTSYTLCASLQQYCYHFASFKTETSAMLYFNVYFIHINAF